MKCLTCFALACSLLAAQSRLPLDKGWTPWSPRAEAAPLTSIKDSLLVVAGNNNPAVCGGWEFLQSGISAGKWYRLSADYRWSNADYEPSQILLRIDWQTADGKRAGHPEYAWEVTKVVDGSHITVAAPAPEGAAAAKLQLLLWNAPRAVVRWGGVSFGPVTAPPPRWVRIAAINDRPRDSASSAESVGRFLATIERTVTAPADLIVLPEGITVVGTAKSYLDVAEPIPGPVTERLGVMARKKNAYIVAGVYEREGTVLYNTAVLIDRAGRVAGKYRKVYIPREEMEGGITPGSEYPVFETDFGRLGLMICWDVQYADPARALALRGAEIVAMPIWGGNTTLAKARAIENHVFLATSGYDYPTHVLDPDGVVLAEARGKGTAAVVTVDLNRRYTEKWLGNMRGRFFRELRGDTVVDPRAGK